MTASEQPPLDWHQPKGRSIGAGILSVFLALISVGAWFFDVAAIFADMTLPMRATTILVLTSLGIFNAALARICWLQARGQWGTRVRCDDEGIFLKLPRDRSLVHRPPRSVRNLRWEEIDAIGIRPEAYAAQFFAMFQRTYWLMLTNGERILVFEDRALETPYATKPMMDLVEAIAVRGGIPIFDLKMVEGKGGLLGAWWTEPPGEGAPPIAPRRLASLRRRVTLTQIALTLSLAALSISMALN